MDRVYDPPADVPKDDPYANPPRLPEGPEVDPRGLLAGEGPVELDLGSGRGWFIVERLEADPRARVLGLEIKRKWATIVDERLHKRGLADRGRVFADDARSALARFPDGCLSVVCVHFPDPWWKKRHRKRLLLTDEVIGQIARVLAPAGELFVQTDVLDRAAEYEASIAREPRLVPWGATPRVDENPYGALSPRERRAMADGLPVVRLRYRRARSSGAP